MANYFEIYKDVWNFHKKYIDRERDDSLWACILRDGDIIWTKYAKSKFAADLLNAEMSEFKRIDENGKH